MDKANSFQPWVLFLSRGPSAAGWLVAALLGNVGQGKRMLGGYAVRWRCITERWGRGDKKKIR